MCYHNNARRGAQHELHLKRHLRRQRVIPAIIHQSRHHTLLKRRLGRLDRDDVRGGQILPCEKERNKFVDVDVRREENGANRVEPTQNQYWDILAQKHPNDSQYVHFHIALRVKPDTVFPRTDHILNPRQIVDTVNVVIVFAVLPVNPSLISHPNGHRVRTRTHLLQKLRVHHVVLALALEAPLAVQTQTQQPLPVHAVEAQHVAVAEEQVAHHRVHRVVFAEVHRLGGGVVVGEGRGVLEERSEGGGVRGEVVVVVVGVGCEACNVEVD